MSTPCNCVVAGGKHAPWCAMLTGQELPHPLDRRVETSALDVQVGGDHYKGMAIQPVEFIHANDIPYLEGNIIKYVCRWKSKNGVADLEKAKHYIELLVELEARRGKA